MSFDKGNVSFRMFYLPPGLQPEVITKFAAHAAPPIETLGANTIAGWCGPRHLLDTDLSNGNCVFGGYLFASLMKAERKIPEAMLRAHCQLEELAALRARQASVLPRQVRAEIRDEVVSRLLPTMPPTMTGIPVAVHFRRDRILAGSMSDSQIDALTLGFRQAAGIYPLPLTAESAAIRRCKIKASELAPTVFSPDAEIDAGDEIVLGMEFLTWLWFWWEVQGGTFCVVDSTPYGLMLEGPVTFYREGKGTHEALFRNGLPLNSREAGTALLTGKLIRRVRLTIAQGERMWTATIDCDFGVRGLRLPKCEQLGREEILMERMQEIETFIEAFLCLYDRFVLERANSLLWAKTLAEIHAWVSRHAQC